MAKKLTTPYFGFKATDSKMKCRGTQYILNKTFTIEYEKEVATCNHGYHYCKHLMDVFNYYDSYDMRVFTVESPIGAYIDKEHDKVAVSKIKFTKELTLNNILTQLHSETVGNKKFDPHHLNWNVKGWIFGNASKCTADDLTIVGSIFKKMDYHPAIYVWDVITSCKENMLAYSPYVLKGTSPTHVEKFIKQGVLVPNIEKYFNDHGIRQLGIRDVDSAIAFAEVHDQLDMLASSDNEDIRIAVAKKGKKLDVLINDKSWKVRKQVAKLGYKPKVLQYDPNSKVSTVAIKKLLKM